MLIDHEGNFKWNAPIKMGERFYFTQKTGQGMFYVSNKDINYVSFEHAKKTWDKKEELTGRILFTPNENNEIIALIGQRLVKIDIESGQKQDINFIRFSGGEVPTSIQMIKDNIVMSSNQNVMMIDQKGNEVYHHYFEAPEQSFGAKMALATASAAADVAATNATRNAVTEAFQGGGSQKSMNKVNNKLGFASSAMKFSDDLESQMEARYSENIASSRRTKLILTKSKLGIVFKKINIETGEEVGEIILKDREPMYAIDHITQQLYVDTNGIINSYKLD